MDILNARMDRRSTSGGIIRRLIQPVRIKVPLEMAAAAIVIALIVYLGGVKEPKPLYQITITESEERLHVGDGGLKSETMALEGTAPAEDAVDITEKGSVGESKPAKGDLDKALNGAARIPPPAKGDIDEKSGVIREPAPSEGKRDKKSGAVREDTPAERDTDKIASVTQKHASGKLEKTDGIKHEPAPLETAQDKIDGFTRGAAPADSLLEETRIILRESTLVTGMMEELGAAQPAMERAPTKEASLQDNIRSLGGNIIEVEYLEGTETPVRMLIEIPVGKFESLIQELKKRGELQAPPTEIKRKADELVRVELIFQRVAPMQ
jgi:hypothetical protein